MSKKILQVLLLLFSFLVICSCSKSSILNNQEEQWLQENDSITVAIYPYYPPFQFVNKQNELDGVFLDYLDLLEDKINYKFYKKTYDRWPDLLRDLKNNKVNFVLEIQETEQRKSYLNFYAPLFESEQVIVTRKDAGFGKTIEDLANKTIVLPQDYAISESIKQIYPEYNVTHAGSELECLKKLNSGEFDAYIGPIAVTNYFIRTEKLVNLKINSGIGLDYNPSFATNKKNTKLDKIISKALSSITKEERKSILNNWFYDEVTPFYQTSQFWIWVSFITLLSFIVATSFNAYLKYKIKQRTEELLIAKDVAEESNRLKTNFIKNIPQEIRTPLNGIIGLSDFLNDDQLNPKERKKFSEMIIGNSTELLSIIDNILEISQIQSNRFTIRLTETNLRNVFQSLVSNFEAKANEKNTKIYLENDLSDTQNLIMMDRSKLNKILNALLDNAVKYTTEGSITISYTVNDAFLFIYIKDTGIGINEKNKSFLAKNLASNSENITIEPDGLGFGLIIAKKNADFIGGQITLESEENQGTTFILKIPYNPIAKTTTDNNNPTKNSSKLQKHIILIAEDGETNFLFLKTILSKMSSYDFTIYRAENGKEAVTICEENEAIDLVLMDIKMPIMDGYDATKYIKKMRPNLPIIAQTAYSVEEDVQKALDAGCDDFVSKPLDRKILTPILDKYFPVFKNRNKTINSK